MTVSILLWKSPPCVTGNDSAPVTISPPTVTSEPGRHTTPLVPTYPLPPGGRCLFHMNGWSIVRALYFKEQKYVYVCVWEFYPPVITHCHFQFPLLDECWSPLGVHHLPPPSFRASSQQTGHPPEAARLHGWDPLRDLQVYQDQWFVDRQGGDSSCRAKYRDYSSKRKNGVTRQWLRYTFDKIMSLYT